MHCGHQGYDDLGQGGPQSNDRCADRRFGHTRLGSDFDGSADGELGAERQRGRSEHDEERDHRRAFRHAEHTLVFDVFAGEVDDVEAATGGQRNGANHDADENQAVDRAQGCGDEAHDCENDGHDQHEYDVRL